MSTVPLPAKVGLVLTRDEVSSLLTCLMKFPAEQVYGLLKKIEQQCVDQAKASVGDSGGNANLLYVVTEILRAEFQAASEVAYSDQHLGRVAGEIVSVVRADCAGHGASGA